MAGEPEVKDQEQAKPKAQKVFYKSQFYLRTLSANQQANLEAQSGLDIYLNQGYEIRSVLHLGPIKGQFVQGAPDAEILGDRILFTLVKNVSG